MIGKNGKLNAENLKQSIKKIKGIRVALGEKLTASQLKAMKGFEHLSDDVAKAIVEQLTTYAHIILRQLNRLK